MNTVKKLLPPSPNELSHYYHVLANGIALFAPYMDKRVQYIMEEAYEQNSSYFIQWQFINGHIQHNSYTKTIFYNVNLLFFSKHCHYFNQVCLSKCLFFTVALSQVLK